jgi:hypothetical protein
MYAAVLSRVFAESTTVERVPPPAKPETPPEPPKFSRSDLDRARREASKLIQQSRYSQAAEVLAAVVQPASEILGSADDDLASLRLELANVLFEGGDYRRAAPAYGQLAADLARRRGSDADVVLRCRLQEATCHALVGETTQALRQLEDLLRDERKIFGEADPRTLELRRQIGLLQLGAGQRRAAEKTLQQLEADLTRLHGPGHPAVTAVTDVLTGLHRSGHG